MQGKTRRHELKIRNQRILKDKLLGMTNKEIASKYNMTPANVSNILCSSDAKQVLEQQAKSLMALSPTIIAQLEDSVHKGKQLEEYLTSPIEISNIPKDSPANWPLSDTKDQLSYLKIIDDRISNILRALNLFTSSASTINQTIINNNQQTLNVQVIQALGDLFKQPTQENLGQETPKQDDLSIELEQTSCKTKTKPRL